MDKFFKDQLLYDYYGSFLTERQQKVMSLYYEEDLSLTEISERLKISRQAVYDIIHRSLKVLKNFEANLLLVSKEEELSPMFDELVKDIQYCLDNNLNKQELGEKLSHCLEIIKEIKNEM